MTLTRIALLGLAVFGTMWIARKVGDRNDVVVVAERELETKAGKIKLRLIEQGQYNTGTRTWEGPSRWGVDVQLEDGHIEHVPGAGEIEARQFFDNFTRSR